MKFLYFSAPWCGPCKVLGPIMNRVAEKHEVEKIIVDTDPDSAIKYGVRGIPTVVLVDENGEVLARTSGVKQEEFFYEMIEEATKQ